jgi:hypothetical protein
MSNGEMKHHKQLFFDYCTKEYFLFGFGASEVLEMNAEVSKAVKWPKRMIMYELRSWKGAVAASRQGWPSSKRKHDISVIGHSVFWQWIKSDFTSTES